MIRLKDIAEIRSGVPDNLLYHSGTDVRVIRMKNINHFEQKIELTNLDSVAEAQKKIPYLRHDDILIVAKGDKNTATVYKRNIDKCVATNQFFIITIVEEIVKIIPEYLTWYLNNPAKEYFNQNVSGAVVSNLRKETLELLEIVIPRIEIQSEIIEIHSKIIEQQKLSTNVMNDRLKLLNHYIQNHK